jgi:hypothetical protein
MTSVYVSTIHCSCAVLALSSRDKVGKATLTMVVSTLITKTLKQMTASAAVECPADRGVRRGRRKLCMERDSKLIKQTNQVYT